MKFTNEFTISLHCGCSKKVVRNQMEALQPLENKYKIHWNNRINRHPTSYDSYSELWNDAVTSSPTEHIILINDRCSPQPHEIEKIINLLDYGFGAVALYSVGFIGVTKELFRHIGWMDERFYGGGNEDDDFVLRLRLADLAYYESCEALYDYSWKSPLFPPDGAKCAKSGPYFHSKWKTTPNAMIRVIPEQNYPKYDALVGPRRYDISESWLKWSDSVTGKDFMVRPNQGPSRTYHFRTPEGVEFRRVIG